MCGDRASFCFTSHKTRRASQPRAAAEAPLFERSEFGRRAAGGEKHRAPGQRPGECLAERFLVTFFRKKSNSRNSAEAVAVKMLFARRSKSQGFPPCRGESLFFACAKKSNQKKAPPASRPPRDARRVRGVAGNFRKGLLPHPETAHVLCAAPMGFCPVPTAARKGTRKATARRGGSDDPATPSPPSQPSPAGGGRSDAPPASEIRGDPLPGSTPFTGWAGRKQVSPSHAGRFATMSARW